MEDHKKIEDDYNNNKQNPGPSKQALEDNSDKPAGRTVSWAIIIAVGLLLVVGLIYYFSSGN